MKSEPIFVMDGAIAMPSGHARGPWDPRSLHGGAPGALLAREIERAQPGAEMAVVRLTFDFLGAVPLAALEARAWVVRPLPHLYHPMSNHR